MCELIVKIFRNIRVIDNSGHSTKWRRLDFVFNYLQNTTSSINTIFRFITEALLPVTFVNNIDRLESARTELNKTLMFSGLEYGTDGKFRKILSATTINEVQR